MRPSVHRLFFLAILALGATGVVLKISTAVEPVVPETALLPAIAELTDTVALSNRGPYEAQRYVARACLGEIWVLPLRRNGEAADLLPGVQGFTLDGNVTGRFPALAYTIGRLLAFTGLRSSEPRVYAFAEKGSCDLAGRIGSDAF
jgi:hypothetical protein